MTNGTTGKITPVYSDMLLNGSGDNRFLILPATVDKAIIITTKDNKRLDEVIQELEQSRGVIKSITLNNETVEIGEEGDVDLGNLLTGESLKTINSESLIGDTNINLVNAIFGKYGTLGNQTGFFTPQVADNTITWNLVNNPSEYILYIDSYNNAIYRYTNNQYVLVMDCVTKEQNKGLSTNDYTNADKAAVDTISSKANASEVVKSISVNGQAQTKDGNGNVNILSVDGADGVTPHIGSNGNWYFGQTDTEVKARGVDGISVSDPADIEVVHNLEDEKSENFDPTSQVAVMGSDMGKVLKTAISTLIDSMGEYCFPNGRPTLSFETPKWNVVQNLTNVDTDYSALRVDKNGELTIHITAQSGCVMGSVVVMMGGVDVTSTYYTAGTIYIPQVTGDIVITATAVNIISSLGYVKPENLVFMLDGIHQGSDPNVWTDLINGVVFTPNGATKDANGWSFDGVDDYMAGDSNMGDFDPYTHTIEICYNSGLTNTSYYAFVDAGGKLIANYIYNFNSYDFYVFRGTKYNDSHTEKLGALSPAGKDNGNGIRVVSYNGIAGNNNSGMVNGVATRATNLTNSSEIGHPSVGARYKESLNNNQGGFMDFFKGTIYAIRVYNTNLTISEILANQKKDNERFELGLTLPNS